MQYVVIALRCLIGAVFLMSSVSKVAGRSALDSFVASLRELRPWSARPARLAAYAVVVAEFAVWSLLSIPGVAAVGFVAAAGLLAVFAAGIAVALRDGVRATCRCFGASGARLGYRHVTRNVALMILAVFGAAATTFEFGSAHAGGVAVAVVFGLVLGGLVAMADDIVDLFEPAGNPDK